MTTEYIQYPSSGGSLFWGDAVANLAALPASDTVGVVRQTLDTHLLYTWTGSAWLEIPADEIVGPGSSTDNAVVRWDGTTGKAVQNSGIIVDDANSVTGIVDLTTSGVTSLNGQVNLGTFVQGAVPYYTTIGGLTFDTVNLFWDETHKRLGIGTSAPSTNLHNAGRTTLSGVVTLGLDGVLSMEPVTKQQLDAAISGVSVKAGVAAATTANITLSGAQTIDGVAVVATNRVLVKNQTTNTENGIYVAAAGAWARATDADSPAELDNALVTVESGTVNANTGWYQTTNSPVIGVDPVVFTQFFGAGTYAASGQGIVLTGSTFSLQLDGPSLSQSASGVKVNAVDLTSQVTGLLPKTNGGTGISSTATFPSSGVVVTEAATETLTNKTFDSTSTLTGATAASFTNGGSTITLPAGTGTLATLARTETFTSKTINGSNNTITNVSLTTGVTGVLPVANGGTNSAASLVNNRMMQSSGGAVVEAPVISANKAIRSDANGIVTSATTTATELDFVAGVTSAIQTQLNAKMTNPMTTAGDVIYGGASGTPTRLATGTAGDVLIAGATPSYVSTFTTAKRINGSADVNQFIVQGNATQTSAPKILIIQKSDGTELLSTSNTGQNIVGPTSGSFSGNRIQGVNDGTAATSGDVGEQLINTQSGPTNAASSGTFLALVNVVLTKGDWALTGYAEIHRNGATMTDATILAIGSTSASSAGTTAGLSIAEYGVPDTTSSRGAGSIPNYRVNVSSNTTYYLNVKTSYTGGPPQWVGTITATRVR